LSVSRKLARILGGDVLLLRSEFGKGSAFQVTLIVSTSTESEYLHKMSFLPEDSISPPSLTSDRRLLVEIPEATL
ncbi:MAG: hypothetical protein ACXWC9_10870, partial [Pseudobdellovibrionaceae bacterium]